MSSFTRLISITVPVIIIVVGLGSLVVWSRQPDRFPLKTVEIRSGLKEVTEDEIKAQVLPYLDKGFFWLNVSAVQKNLQLLPWVQAVELRRIWPDKLLIVVQEKRAQARWGEKGILSTDGAIFYPTGNIPEGIPQFNGPETRAKEVLQQYLTLLEMLGPIGLTVQQLDLSMDGSWRMRLDSGLDVILGKTGLHERMARFVLAYKGSFHAESMRIAYIDLRYTNGFAIGWKEGEK